MAPINLRLTDVFQKPITDLIMRRFDKFTEAAAAPPAPKPSEPTPPVTVKTETKANGNGNSTKEVIPKATNGTNNKRVKSESLSLSDAEEDDESQLSSLESSPPPKKKQKASRSTEDSDAAFAARLQAEENRARRATRGAATGKRKAAPAKKVKKERKKKSKARVGSDEDSDVEGGEKKEVKRNGGFHVRRFECQARPGQARPSIHPFQQNILTLLDVSYFKINIATFLAMFTIKLRKVWRHRS